MNVLSLFDGMSCGMIALERAGVTVTEYYASEIDNYATRVSEDNYPNIVRLGDVRNWREWELPRIDLLIAGSPCQGFSFEGNQLGFDDPRSKLFFEFVDILNHYKPRYFLLENVRMKKMHQQVITDILGVEPILINSALVSAQNRVRLYWTNIPVTEKPEDKGILLADIIESGVVDRDKSYCIDANYGRGTSIKIYKSKHKRQIVFEATPLVDEKLNYRKLTPLECERLQTVPDNYTASVSNSQRYKMLGNGWTVDVIAHIFNGLQN